MATPKKPHIVSRVLSLFVAVLLATPPLPALANTEGVVELGDTLYHCAPFSYTDPVKKKTVEVYQKWVDLGEGKFGPAFKRKAHRGSPAFKNPGEHLYADNKCIDQSPAHLFKGKDGAIRLDDGKGLSKPLKDVKWAQAGDPVEYPEKITRTVTERVEVQVPAKEDSPTIEDGVPSVGSGSAQKPGGKVEPVKGDDTEVDPNDPVGTIIRLILKSSELDQDIAAQFKKFIWEKGYTEEKYRASHVGGDPLLGKMVEKWVIEDRIAPARAKAAGQAKPSTDDPAVRDIAAMYYILGAEPGISGKYKEILSGNSRFLGILLDCLSRYAHVKPDTNICAPSDLEGPKLSGPGGLIEWTNDFLPEAAQAAWDIYTRNKRDPGQAEQVANEMDRGGDVVGGTPGSGRTGKLPTTSPPFSVEQLFGKWGDKNVFHLDGRLLAIVPRLERTFKNGQSVMEQKVGLYDISSPGNVYGITIMPNDDSDKAFSLKNGGKTYVWRMEPQQGGYDTIMTITSGDGKIQPTEGSFGGGKIPTVNEIFQMRAQKALDSGLVSDLGGKEYRVTAESSQTGYFLFWSKEKMDLIASGKVRGRDVTPDGISKINRVEGGVVRSEPGPVPTGIVGGDGKYYDMVRADNGVWSPVPGKKPEDTPAADAAKADGKGGSPTGGSTSPQADASWPIYPGYTPDAEKLSAINGQLAAMNLRIYQKAGAKEGEFNFILANKVPKNGGIPMQGNGVGYSFELVGPMLLANDAMGTTYIDASRGIKNESEGKWGYLHGLGTYQAKESGQKVFNGSDNTALAHALIKMGFSEADGATLLDRALNGVKANPGQEFFYVVQSTQKDKIAWIDFGADKIFIWPNDGKKEATSANRNDEKVVGTGTIFDKGGLALQEQAKEGEFSAPDVKIDGVDIKGVQVTALGKGSDPKTARLFKAENKDKRTAEWWLKFTLKPKSGNSAVSSAIKVFEEFPAPAQGAKDPKVKARIDYPGDGIVIRGVDMASAPEGVNIPETWDKIEKNNITLTMILPRKITTEGKPAVYDITYGLLAVYDHPGDQGKYKSLLGVVAFWGMTEKEAQELAAVKKG